MAGDVRFIRVNGRVVPIKGKGGPSKAQRQKNYNKYGDGANQASRIDAKYDAKASKGTTAYGVASVAGLGAALFAKNKFVKAGGAALALGAAALGHRKAKKQRSKVESSRQKEYVKTFGTDSDGNRPQKRKK